MIKLVLESRVPIKVWTDDIEDEARRQLVNVGALPFVFHHVASMPDVHWGMGATIGSVIATRGAICPAAVGVDIGCGMLAVKTTVQPARILDRLPALRHEIERGVPVGFADHHAPLARAVDYMGQKGKPAVASEKEATRAAHQLGTLGGGNHFIEVCLDEAGAVWVMLHSGSRGIGNKTATRHIDKAKGTMRQLFIDLPDPDLAYFAQGTPEFQTYMDDLLWCQEYAFVNRALMQETVLRALAHVATGDANTPIVDGPTINCHHNYVAWEEHFGENVMITRKGAIRARAGDMGIIPGSMGTGSFIVRGLGNRDAFDSAPHGAGRKMSRTKARKTFSKADLEAQTAGVECRKDDGVLDEIPGAYKPIGDVIENSADLVEVVARLKQVVCVKG